MSNPFVGRVVREKRHGELNLLDAETALRTLADPAGHVEIRPLPAALSRSILPGSDVAGLLLAASKAEYAGNTVYLTLNPVTPKQHGSSKDPDVTCYRWLFVDVDPIREHGRERESATDAEKAQAAAVALAIADWLTDQDWPEPVQVDSGNGYYLLYRVDLPNNAQSRQILKDVLAVLGGQHDTAGAGVDRKVHNASRIAKLPGSWSRKGTNTPERPWRQSCLLRVPETVGVVTVEQLQAVAGLGKTVSPSTPTPLPAALAGHKKTGDGGAAYLRAVLDRECRRILLAIPGHPKEGRNNALFRAACNVGEFVASGAIAHHEAHARLLEAALHAGLEERESLRTIASAFERTATKPRTVPDRNAEPSKNGRPPSPQQAGTDPTTDAETPILIRASSVTPRKVRWLWEGRIPVGKLCTFAGQMGIGKTFLLLDIAARVSRGAEWPDLPGIAQEPGDVLVISGEDDVDDTLVPRLVECQADLDRVAFFTLEAMATFSLANLQLLDRAADQLDNLRVVIIDPPTSYLGDVDDHKNAELRRLLTPLMAWSAARGVSVLFNTHLNKGGAANLLAIYRVIGSVAWMAAVRAGHLIAEHQDDDRIRIFAPMKSNLGRKRPALSYTIDNVDGDEDRAVVVWHGEVDITADQAVNAKPATSRKVVARDWLVERFAERREWEADDLFRAAKQVNISRDAVFEAKRLLGLPRAKRVTAENGDVSWVWWVPLDWEHMPERQEGDGSLCPF